MGQQFAAQEAWMDEKFAAQTAQVMEMVDQKLAAQTEHVENTMVQAIEAAVAILRANQDELVGRIVQRTRTVTENVEGRKIVSRAEESQSHKRTLDDHKNRIGKLEEAAG